MQGGRHGSDGTSGAAQSPYLASVLNAMGGPQKDPSKALRRLAGELKALKDKLAGMEDEKMRVAWGDHAMLSGKPLGGYRCMACDRPLEKLDEAPGPYVPSNLFSDGEQVNWAIVFSPP